MSKISAQDGTTPHKKQLAQRECLLNSQVVVELVRPIYPLSLQFQLKVNHMAWKDLKSKISAHHSAVPQRHATAMLALDNIEAGIHILETLGHRLALVEATDPVEHREFPKMMYHPQFGSRTVGDESEQSKAQDEGWSDQINPEPLGQVPSPEMEHSPDAPA